jgi:hypothetical protein
MRPLLGLSMQATPGQKEKDSLCRLLSKPATSHQQMFDKLMHR